MDGVVVIDKPAGMTSAGVVACVKRSLNVKKVGHTGTLDPFATGVLVCCVNQATRLAQFLTFGRKRYQGVMRLGVRTDTQDLTGNVVSETDFSSVTQEEIIGAFAQFTKITEQIPPAFSAVKHLGTPLYKFARKGVFVKKAARPIQIYDLRVVDIQMPDVAFEVCCSQGTYVRTLCSDIGDTLGCGAHLKSLRRSESGGFSLSDAMSLDSLKARAALGDFAGYLTPMKNLLKDVAEIMADGSLIKKIRNGGHVSGPELGLAERNAGSLVRVVDFEKNLIAILRADEQWPACSYLCVFK